ncbi:hypothetical protein EV356DRAFT_331408 [Viridothelium virens]|uniref:Uncharacterized protein n=1 Tax=Viridothelium virens TaxID=1048519 RepID=A0A6A6HIH8_VIRVR|nr:hypothetical protein EV356DRAFT_331408 [Viridothelium virens]
MFVSKQTRSVLGIVSSPHQAEPITKPKHSIPKLLFGRSHFELVMSLSLSLARGLGERFHLNRSSVDPETRRNAGKVYFRASWGVKILPVWEVSRNHIWKLPSHCFAKFTTLTLRIRVAFSCE